MIKTVKSFMHFNIFLLLFLLICYWCIFILFITLALMFGVIMLLGPLWAVVAFGTLTDWENVKSTLTFPAEVAEAILEDKRWLVNRRPL
jgi:hypothetical protein